MKDLSLHILDIVQNSVRANATEISIDIAEDKQSNLLSIAVRDNGKGMPLDQIQKATDPFFTTRTTRKVGLGLPLLKQIAEMCGGNFRLESVVGKGTSLKVDFELDHIDRPDMGDIPATMKALIAGSPDIDFSLSYVADDKMYRISTIDIKEMLEDVSIQEPAVLRFVEEMIRENLGDIKATMI